MTAMVPKRVKITFSGMLDECLCSANNGRSRRDATPRERPWVHCRDREARHRPADPWLVSRG